MSIFLSEFGSLLKYVSSLQGKRAFVHVSREPKDILIIVKRPNLVKKPTNSTVETGGPFLIYDPSPAV